MKHENADTNTAQPTRPGKYGTSGTILFKNGDKRRVTNSLKKVVYQLISDRSGFAIAILPVDLDNRIWMIRFRNYTVKVQLDQRSHALQLRMLQNQYDYEQRKYAHLRKRVFRTYNPHGFSAGIRHAVKTPLIIQPN